MSRKIIIIQLFINDYAAVIYDDLKLEIVDTIKNKITKEHLQNYFKYLFLQANDFLAKMK